MLPKSYKWEDQQAGTGGTCPLCCHMSWAAPSSPERVPGASRECQTLGKARSHGQAGSLFFSCAITQGKGVKNNDLAEAGGGRFESSAWKWRARVSTGRVATTGEGWGKTPLLQEELLLAERCVQVLWNLIHRARIWE